MREVSDLARGGAPGGVRHDHHLRRPLHRHHAQRLRQQGRPLAQHPRLTAPRHRNPQDAGAQHSPERLLVSTARAHPADMHCPHLTEQEAGPLAHGQRYVRGEEALQLHLRPAAQDRDGAAAGGRVGHAHLAIQARDVSLSSLDVTGTCDHSAEHDRSVVKAARMKSRDASNALTCSRICVTISMSRWLSPHSSTTICGDQHPDLTADLSNSVQVPITTLELEGWRGQA